MKNIIYPFIISLIFLLSGCASISVNPISEVNEGETELLKTQKKFVGESIYTAFNYEESFKAKLNTSFNAWGSKCQARNATATKAQINGAPGAMASGNMQCTSFGIPSPLYAAYFIDTDSDGKYDAVTADGAGSPSKLKNPFRLSWKTDRDATFGYKKEVIYQGRDGDTLRLLYREFIDDLARPAFSQTTEYKISESSTIQFKGLTFDIDSADNSAIIYTVISGSLHQ